MDPVAATKNYERWLNHFFAPIAADLHRKHEQMRGGLLHLSLRHVLPLYEAIAKRFWQSVSDAAPNVIEPR